MGNKRGILLIGIIILFFIFVIFINIVSSVSDTNKIDEKVYEKLEENEMIRAVIKIDAENNLEKQETKKEIITNIGKENVKHIFDDEIAVEISKEDLNELKNNPGVESVIIDRPIYAFLQDSVPLINATRVWPIQISGINITGTGETICIIDTGIDFTHPDLIGKNKTCIIDCYNKTCVENCSIGDDNGHGTHVAGIAAASGLINGVGINISLIGVKILDSAGEGIGTDLEAGIDWCVANAATYNISIISMSLGDCSNHTTYCNEDDTASHINAAVKKNISVIAAAGNGPGGSCTGINDTNGPSAPACVENATAVGAVDKNDNIYYQRGPLFELLAPGVNINSTYLGAYDLSSGTSMAAPHVAGAFALFRQFFRLQNGRVPTPFEIKTTLNNTGKIIYDSETEYNFSRINIYSAIDSLMILNTNFISPINNAHTNQNQINFTCRSQTASRFNLRNITFYLWNSTGNLSYNITANISGISNLTTFNYNFSYENSYKWGCLSFNNNSDYSWAYTNYTIIYDTTSPLINLISPENGSTWTSSSTVTFSYNVSDVSIVNCSLIVNNAVDQTDNLTSANTTEIFTKSLSNGDYNWSINCTDSVDNINNSEERKLTVNYTAPVIHNTGGGGGGGTPTPIIYAITTEQASTGYTQILGKKDKIRFTFFDEKIENHTLTITNLGKDYVNLTIQSSIINLRLGIGQSAKLNLTSNDYYNLYVKLNSIANNRANLTVQTIYEEILKSNITEQKIKDNEEKIGNKTNEETIQQNQTNIGGYIKDVLIITLIIAVLVIIFSKKDKIRKKRIKKYKERFKSLRGK